MLSKIILYGCTIAGVYYVVSFIQTYLHRAVAHRVVGGPFYKIHVGSHHTIYNGSHQVADRYSDEERSITLTFVVPYAALQTVALLVLPSDMFVVEFTSCSVVALAHAYVHVHYHLTQTWLDRFVWFRRLRAYHSIHHENTGTNFAVIEPFWDRVLGTYQAPHRDA
jgi:sterol desaturase/sphingolipid hydroxylase (fatty acid hydroxylase superfamily)